jgi:4-aminobutyrate aminotransferase/(S)-3-amino-2-methylpropionate transaminase
MEGHIGAENIACIVAEPVQGEGGFIVPAPEFLPRLAEFCRANRILFVADEIQTGLGRTARWFASEHFDLVPDIVLTAKSLGGGLPIAGVTGPAEAMESVHVGGLGGTFGGNPVACAAALAAVDQIEREGLLERAARLGEIVHSALDGYAERFDIVGDVRGLGAMVAMELVTDRRTKDPAPDAATRVASECHREGLVLLKAGTRDNVIRFLPPLTIGEELLEEGLGIVEKALATATGG